MLVGLVRITEVALIESVRLFRCARRKTLVTELEGRSKDYAYKINRTRKVGCNPQNFSYDSVEVILQGYIRV